MRNKPLILNFHGVGDASRPYKPGEKLYWISRQDLRSVLDLAQNAGKETVLFTSDDSNFRITKSTLLN